MLKNKNLDYSLSTKFIEFDIREKEKENNLVEFDKILREEMDFYDNFKEEGNFIIDLFINKIKMIKNKGNNTINIIIEQILKNFDVLINSKRFFYRILSFNKIDLEKFNEIDDFIIDENYFKNNLNKLIYYYIIIDIY